MDLLVPIAHVLFFYFLFLQYMVRLNAQLINKGNNVILRAVLADIEARDTRDDNTRCVDTARRHGLKVKALMSLGHPGESTETVAQTMAPICTA